MDRNEYKIFEELNKHLKDMSKTLEIIAKNTNKELHTFAPETLQRMISYIYKMGIVDGDGFSFYDFKQRWTKYENSFKENFGINYIDNGNDAIDTIMAIIREVFHLPEPKIIGD